MRSHRSAVAAFRTQLVESMRSILRPPPKMDVPTWADTYRHLSTSSGAIGGKWQTHRVEVARGPMMAVTEDGVQTISLMVCTQTLKTSLQENVLGYYAHLDPCPMLLCQPKDEAAKSFSKERLIPMIKASPALRGLFHSDKTRKSDDTIQYKAFTGGFLALVSAGSPTNLAMRAIRVTLLDEIDKYETTKEGDPVELAEERTATFTDSALRIRACSPTILETSRIYASFMAGDQRVPLVRCPHCGEWEYLEFFRSVHWDKDGLDHYTDTAAIWCSRCGVSAYPWSEAERIRAVTTRGGIRWVQTKPFICPQCDHGARQEPLTRYASTTFDEVWQWDEDQQVGRARCECCGALSVPNVHASFTASKLYSPFTTTVALAAKWVTSKSSAEQKQTFYNTQLGQPYSAEVSKTLSHNMLFNRRELYEAELPEGVLVVTVGVDVQSGGTSSIARLEAEVVGWGLGEESWSVDAKRIEGDPARPQVWAELDEYLLKKWRHASGVNMSAMAVCIDTGGHNTQDVYRFAGARYLRNVWGIKGASDTGQWSPIWPPHRETERTRTGYKPIILGVNAAKEAIRQRLLIEDVGPGYCHFPVNRDEGWFSQLTAEKLILTHVGGQTVRKWIKRRNDANEALDCRVYAYAALHGLYVERKFSLDRQAEKLVQVVHGQVILPKKAKPKVHRSRYMED